MVVVIGGFLHALVNVVLGIVIVVVNNTPSVCNIVVVGAMWPCCSVVGVTFAVVVMSLCCHVVVIGFSLLFPLITYFVDVKKETE